MLLAKVIGSETSTIRVNSIDKTKFKIVELINPDGSTKGGYSIVEDAVGVGSGETVLLAEDEIAIAKMYDGREDIPIRFCIVAKVESINLVNQ